MRESGHTLWLLEIVIPERPVRDSTLISSQVLYGFTLNTDFLFDNRNWHAVDLRYKRNLLSCI